MSLLDLALSLVAHTRRDNPLVDLSDVTGLVSSFGLPMVSAILCIAVEGVGRNSG